VPRTLALLLALAAGLVLACGGDDDDSVVGANVDEVVRNLLQTATDETAPGQELVLSQVIVPPGDAIAPHTHPGTQLAVIVQGRLTYTVIDGEVEVTRDAATDEAQVESFSSGDAVELETGDAVHETAGMVHEARNDGEVPVIIYLSSLFPEGAPASSPAD
jgi:quercetin dioxygenase-like cupin family protein